MRKIKKRLNLSLTDAQAKFLAQMVDTTGMKNEQEVLTTFVSILSAYQKKYSAVEHTSIEEEINTMFDELSEDSALLSELNGWSAHNRDPRNYINDIHKKK